MEFPSAPPESQALIDFDNEDSKDESILPVTPNTANVERIAAEELDTQNVRASLFRNERFAACIWCIFIFLYWTTAIWLPVFYQKSFMATPGIIIWCFGFIGILSTSYRLKQGANPSGSTKEEPNKINGKGKYAAMLLVCSVLVDFTLRIYDAENRILAEPQQYDLILVIGHTISIFWASFFYYGRFREINPEIATVAFLSEWIDIIVTIVSFEMLAWYYNNGCYGHYLCRLYFIIIPIKFILWILPMIMIKGWGTRKNGTGASIQLFITNLLTDLPIIIMIQYTQLYSMYIIIFIDLLIKTFIIIRGTSYYLIFNVWLNRGLRKQRIRSKHDKKRKKEINKQQNQASESEMIALNPNVNVDDSFVHVSVN